MVSWHRCTFINWEKPCELPRFIFLLSLRLNDSKLMLKLYYLSVLTSLLTGCDTNVALTLDCPFRAWKLWWKLKLTTPETVSKRKIKPSNWNFINKGIQICSKMWAPDQWMVNKGKIVIRCMQSSTIPKYRSNIFWPVHTYLIILSSGKFTFLLMFDFIMWWIGVTSGQCSFFRLDHILS